MYQDIQLLNKLRNRCAHGWGNFVVTNEIVTQYIEPMAMKRAINAANDVNPIFFPPVTRPKTILVGTLAALVTLANLMKPFSSKAETNDSGKDG